MGWWVMEVPLPSLLELARFTFTRPHTPCAPPTLSYLIAKGLMQVDQLALMASVEDRLEDKIFPVLPP